MLLILLAKDLKLEIRSKEIVPSMFVFGLTVILVFALSFSNSSSLMPDHLSGLLWLVILFTSTFGLNRSFYLEKNQDAIWSWLAAPIDRGLVFLSKMISIIIFTIIAELLFLIPFLIFFKIQVVFSLVSLIFIILLGTCSIISVGALISAITFNTSIREILIPILLFPTVTPVIISATKSTSLIFQMRPAFDLAFWVLIMFTFFTIFSLLGYFLINKIIEE